MEKNNMLSTAVHTLYPYRCMVCDGILSKRELAESPTGATVHERCRRKLFPVGDTFCMRCGRPIIGAGREYCDECEKRLQMQKSPLWDGQPAFYVAQSRAVYIYRGPVKMSMYRLKYSNRREYAAFMARAACERWGGWMRGRGIDIVAPIPMYKPKERKRGYNQAALIAERIADMMGLCYAENLVKRTRNTLPQKKLNDVERKNNLKNAFQMTDFVVKYKKVLLVDDIFTTGSTAEAVAEQIHEAGAEGVYFLAICTGTGR
ncbi:MAG: ComF family protein [Clostridiales bacterium]|nr:ComF family protein [Clostridiales bacterium]